MLENHRKSIYKLISSFFTHGLILRDLNRYILHSFFTQFLQWSLESYTRLWLRLKKLEYLTSVEYLHRYINFMISVPKYKMGIKSSKNDTIILYLMFVDDCLIFCKANKNAARKLRTLINLGQNSPKEQKTILTICLTVHQEMVNNCNITFRAC